MYARKKYLNKDLLTEKKYKWVYLEPAYYNIDRKYGPYKGLSMRGDEKIFIETKKQNLPYVYRAVRVDKIPYTREMSRLKDGTEHQYSKLRLRNSHTQLYGSNGRSNYMHRKIFCSKLSPSYTKKGYYTPSSYIDSIKELRVGTTGDGSIHHYTEEYYLSYLTKHYDFSLTHNDLLSIEKNHIPLVIDEMNKYFKKINKDLMLQHVEVIDHNIYKNKYFIFAFSKVFIKGKLHSSTNSSSVYITEFVAFSKYPDNDELAKMISDVSSIVYKSLLEQDLDINCRLIDQSKEPENNMVFTRVYGNNKDYNTSDVSISNMVFSERYYPYLNVKILQDEFSKSLDKILILYGENGSGKTKLSNILSLHLQNDDYEIVVVSGSDIEYEPVIQGIETKLYNSINKSKNVCIVIDDIDPYTLNRNSVENGSKNTFFNKLLTITDGNLDLKFKIIITTNHIIQKEEDMPLYRSGRLFDCIYIRYLTKDEAKEILKLNEIDTKTISEFLSKQDEKVKQSDVAQLIHFTKNKITKSYYLDKDAKTKIRTKRAGLIND